MKKVLEGIEAAKVGLGVKINMVVQKGVNEKISCRYRYFKEKGHILRFIELWM